MSSARVKVGDYYARGDRAMSIEEVLRVFQTHPWIPIPKQLIILDGDVVTKGGTAVGLKPQRESLMILTPISNSETVLHEAVHGWGFGELATQVITKGLNLKKFSLFKRNVGFTAQPDKAVAMQVLKQYGVESPDGTYPNIRHYYLQET